MLSNLTKNDNITIINAKNGQCNTFVFLLIRELIIDHFAAEKTYIITRPTYAKFMKNIKRIVLSIPL